MATSAERMRALRERQRRGRRRLTIEVTEDDLRAIAKRGYQGPFWTIWTDLLGDKGFLFALVLPSAFFFVAIGRAPK